MARKSHTVAAGDTLSAIARENDTTVQKLIELNPKYKDNPNLILAGQTVTLPNAKGAPSMNTWATDFFGSVTQDEWGKAFREAEGGYPAHWGEPPTGETRDLVDLPANYGRGSSTLRDWIQQNLDTDTQPDITIPENMGPDQKTPAVGEENIYDQTADLPIGDQEPADLLELGAVPELLADPAYRAFMASFGATSGDIDLSMQAAVDRMVSQATRQFGYYTPPEGADAKDQLRAGYREGGLYDIETEKAGERVVDVHAGKGMGFSGQVTKDLGELQEDKTLAESDYEKELLLLYNEAELEKQKAHNQLIKDKLAEEAAAYERIGIFQAGA